MIWDDLSSGYVDQGYVVTEHVDDILCIKNNKILFKWSLLECEYLPKISQFGLPVLSFLQILKIKKVLI